MLRTPLLALLLLPPSLTAAACGDAKLEPRASSSAAQLERESQIAAAPLVEMEQLARAGDAAGLCSRVYRSPGQPCERAFGRLLEEHEAVSMEIRAIQIARSGRRGVATVAVTTVEDGKRRTRTQTFDLVEDGGWYVRLQQ